MFQAVGDSVPSIVKEVPNDQLPSQISEYAYGFWFRFLTHYPTRMFMGKDKPWYFIARLTSNQNFGASGSGDRLLVTYQGDRYYQTQTEGAEPKNIGYPDDIEGLWTFHYFSYSKTQNRAVAFWKYADGAIQR